MKNLIKSQTFITAVIFAAVSFGIILICLLYGKNDSFQFVPDDPYILFGPAASWTESANPFSAEPEFIMLNTAAEPEESEEPEQYQDEEVPAAAEDSEEAPVTNFTEPVPPTEDEINVEIALTVMPEKPEPPELPEHAYRGPREGEATLADVEAHKALDPALTNPNVKPDGTPAASPPAPVERKNPQDDQHLWGTINEAGEIYAPGFGWLPYTGPNIVEESRSGGDWNKIIGSMGGK